MRKQWEDHWQEIKKTWTTTCTEVLGKKTREHKEWLTIDTWALSDSRKKTEREDQPDTGPASESRPPSTVLAVKLPSKE